MNRPIPKRYSIEGLRHRLAVDGKPLSERTAWRMAKLIDRIQTSRKSVVFTEEAVREFEERRTLIGLGSV